MKDIKTKPKIATKAVRNSPKAADRFAKEAVKDIKNVSKDVLIVRLVDILSHSSVNTTRIYTMETWEICRRQIQRPGLLRC